MWEWEWPCRTETPRVFRLKSSIFREDANSVRGWSVRSLGPGGYRGDGNSLDYVNHTGDIKLDLNLEYRTHLFWKLNGAAFVDAGNVWTIRNREMQPKDFSGSTVSISSWPWPTD